MKRLIFALSLLSGLANAQEPDNALLWKISGNGITKPSYLFGTIHMTCDASLDAGVVKALDETGQLYLELDMDDPSLQMELMGGMMMKDGVTMSSLASEADFKAVDEFLQKHIGMSAKLVNNFKPLMLASMLMPKMADCPLEAVEAELVKISQAQNEEVFGLETVKDQIAVFDAIPYKEQMDELVKTAKSNIDESKAEFRKMMDLYRQKDINGLLAYMNESEGQMYSRHSDVLLANRNRNWIPKIEEAANKMPTFFGVGAAHLAGEDGVIALLRKKGYKVEAIN